LIARPAGDQGVLVELDRQVSFAELHASAARARSVTGVAACIVGHSSLYLIFNDVTSFSDRAERVTGALKNVGGSAADAVGREHKIIVSIHADSAPDLGRLLSAAGIDRPTFVQKLRALRLRARYLGFRAGFAYLEGLPAEWNLPRMATPRTNVPAGAFGIASGMAAFYPSLSPGGWNLIGRSHEVFWDPQREPPNLIAAGDTVLLEPTDERLRDSVAPATEVPVQGEPLAEILRPGQLTMIVGSGDLKRYAHGLPVGGAFDQDAANAANQAVGNSPAAATLECTLVGPQLMFVADAAASWYGTEAEVLLNEQQVKARHQFQVRKGDILTVGRLKGGMRGYLAVSGGFANPSPRYAVTPAVIRAGGKLHRGGETPQSPAAAAPIRRGEAQMIHAVAGPHEVSDEARTALTTQIWEVTTVLDRTGIRFRPMGEEIEQPASLPSSGMQFGTVQWHPNGELVVVGPDHPITGGYLQSMTVLSSDRWKLAQLAPGSRVRWMLK
jgi:KipI family sensor histidine kinase inhibitor